MIPHARTLFGLEEGNKMPARKTLARRASADLQKLREIIASGKPWTQKGGEFGGYFDVYGLISGHFFDFALHYCREHDEGSQRELWLELGGDILAQHVKHAPGTRPWGWWKWEAPEMRRVVGIDRDPDDDDDDVTETRLPAFEDPNLPAHFKENYFGCPNAYDGHIYEAEYDYLKRHKLLLLEEKKTGGAIRSNRSSAKSAKF
jgi:hypothetical protein